eukprot:g56579.t1
MIREDLHLLKCPLVNPSKDNWQAGGFATTPEYEEVVDNKQKQVSTRQSRVGYPHYQQNALCNDNRRGSGYVKHV